MKIIGNFFAVAAISLVSFSNVRALASEAQKQRTPPSVFLVQLQGNLHGSWTCREISARLRSKLRIWEWNHLATMSWDFSCRAVTGNYYPEDTDLVAKSVSVNVLVEPTSSEYLIPLKNHLKRANGNFVYGRRLRVREFAAVGGNETIYKLGHSVVLSRDLGVGDIAQEREVLRAMALDQQNRSVDHFINYLRTHYSEESVTVFIENVMKKADYITVVKNTWLIDDDGRPYNYSGASYGYNFHCLSDIPTCVPASELP